SAGVEAVASEGQTADGLCVAMGKRRAGDGTCGALEPDGLRSRLGREDLLGELDDEGGALLLLADANAPEAGRRVHPEAHAQRAVREGHVGGEAGSFDASREGGQSKDV